MNFRVFALLFLLLEVKLLAYSDCKFKFERYEQICTQATKNGVSVEYANSFLLCSKSKERDFEALRKFNPTMLKTHSKNEKIANNSLVGFLPKMREHLSRYVDVYTEAEQRYGVNREIIVAILAKESRLGRYRLKHDSYVVLNTLLRELKADSRRNRRVLKMAQTNLVALMQFCYQSKIRADECSIASSYAGAVGYAQFMPQNLYLARGYNKASADLNTAEDSILSIASFLHTIASFKSKLEWSKVGDMRAIESAWYRYDFEHKNSSFAFDLGKYNCFACKRDELSYLSGYVKKIMRYNSSSNYAVGVLRLAYELR